MSIASPPTSAPPIRGGGGTPPRRRITVAEYERMTECGILTEDDDVELLEEEIFLKMPRTPRHDGTVGKADGAIRPKLPPGWFVRVQSAITTGDSEPEPDLAVARGTPDDYMTRHPTATDLALVIEVAESSLDADRVLKARVYARAGIAVYWVVNLAEGLVHVYTSPSGETASPIYRAQRTFGRDDVIGLDLLDGGRVEIAARDLLPAGR